MFRKNFLTFCMFFKFKGSIFRSIFRFFFRFFFLLFFKQRYKKGDKRKKLMFLFFWNGLVVTQERQNEVEEKSGRSSEGAFCSTCIQKSWLFYFFIYMFMFMFLWADIKTWLCACGNRVWWCGIWYRIWKCIKWFNF